MSMHYFSCSGGTGTDSTKSASRHIMPNLCFASGGICRSCSAFWWIRSTKRRRTLSHAQVGPVWKPQKARWDTLRQTCDFAFSGICGSRTAFWYVRAMKCDALFSGSGGTGTNSIKGTLGHVTSDLCFGIRWGLWVT
jgi:hypothetical protein